MAEVLNDNAKDGAVIPVRFTRLYVTLLVVLTILLTVVQALTQWRLHYVQDDLMVVRYAAFQRHQSQQIVKQALQLTDPDEQNKFSANVTELRRLVPIFERYHRRVQKGQTDDPAIQVAYSDTVQRLYAGIESEFDAFLRSARRMMQLQSFEQTRLPEAQASIQVLLAYEKPFLEEMDGIVRQYNSEVRGKLVTLQSIEFYMYVLTIVTLVAIGLLIFRPAARKLKQTFEQLVEAESQTATANKKLLGANRSLKETRQKLFEATKQQYQQQIDEQKLRTSYLIAGQEDERKRLSRELHDGLGQMLTAIKLQLEGLENSLLKAQAESAEPVRYVKNLTTLKSLVTQTIQETRTISNNLMPTVLSDFGVVPAIKMLAEIDRNEQIEVTFETNLTPDMPRLDKNVEIMLYRVTQEAVSNAIRHAKPSHVHIELTERQNSLQLVVKDDGVGFRQPKKKVNGNGAEPELTVETATASKRRAPSQGLHNIQERTKLLNGQFKIHSTVGKGTKIQVTIPHKTQVVNHDTY